MSESETAGGKLDDFNCSCKVPHHPPHDDPAVKPGVKAPFLAPSPHSTDCLCDAPTVDPSIQYSTPPSTACPHPGRTSCRSFQPTVAIRGSTTVPPPPPPDDAAGAEVTVTATVPNSERSGEVTAAVGGVVGAAPRLLLLLLCVGAMVGQTPAEPSPRSAHSKESRPSEVRNGRAQGLPARVFLWRADEERRTGAIRWKCWADRFSRLTSALSGIVQKGSTELLLVSSEGPHL